MVEGPLSWESAGIEPAFSSLKAFRWLIPHTSTAELALKACDHFDRTARFITLGNHNPGVVSGHQVLKIWKSTATEAAACFRTGISKLKGTSRHLPAQAGELSGRHCMSGGLQSGGNSRMIVGMTPLVVLWQTRLQVIGSSD